MGICVRARWHHAGLGQVAHEHMVVGAWQLAHGIYGAWQLVHGRGDGLRSSFSLVSGLRVDDLVLFMRMDLLVDFLSRGSENSPYGGP